MHSAAPTRPLWWLARWAARLLTGFAVAAAFTLGAWALPGEAAPAEQLAAPPVVAAAPQASVERDLTAPFDLAVVPDLAATLGLVGPATPTVRGVGDAADLVGVSATQPTISGRPGLTALGTVAAATTPTPAARVDGVQAARAPPHA
ncbi:hypothetical protein ACFFMR_03560 [Micromonospora andamanensis]|uniref:Uncharacterized protein n=1 Tax=Micromonospora andamanensis TaxID=1287068 RepID=A0ABQ4HVB7_9ACTN|nr:hypothetical protein [Micromonospora andamanensis]GIJ09608.1 hypothetical protein Van01_28220 [Micromonospora andamanensis]